MPSSDKSPRRSTGTAAGRRRLRVGQQVRQGASLDQLHGEEGPVVSERTQLIHRHDAGMLELAADLGFLDEPPDQVGTFAKVPRAGP